MSTPGPTSTVQFRWIVLLGVWLVYMSFGMTVVSLAPLVESITRDLGISHGSMGLVFGAWQLIFIVSAVPCGSLLDRIGVRHGLLLGALVVATSGFLRSVATDFWTLLLAVGLFGAGGPLVSTGAPKVVSNWFRGQERGFAMGLYITGPAIGSVTTLSLTNSVLMPWLGNDWHLVLRVWASFTLVTGLVWWLVCRHPEMRAQDEAAASQPKLKQWDVVRDLMAQPAVRILLLMSVGIFTFNHGLNNWLPEILRSRGMSPAQAGFWATIPTIIGIAGSLLLPRLATPQRRYIMLCGLCVSAILATLLLRADPGMILLSGLVLQGIARSSLMTVSMLTLVEQPGIGERRAATASGLFFSAAEVGGAGGPLALGLIHDLAGGFGPGLAALTAVTVVLFLCAVALYRLSRQPA